MTFLLLITVLGLKLQIVLVQNDHCITYLSLAPGDFVNEIISPIKYVIVTAIVFAISSFVYATKEEEKKVEQQPTTPTETPRPEPFKKPEPKKKAKIEEISNLSFAVTEPTYSPAMSRFLYDNVSIRSGTPFSVSANVNRIQCMASTQKGGQCRNAAQVGGDYCRIHSRNRV